MATGQRNGRDQFSRMRQLYMLVDHLKLTPKESLRVAQTTLTYYRSDKRLYGVAPTEKRFLLYILRWMCRGKTLEEAIEHSTEQSQQVHFIIQRNQFWKQKNRQY